MLTILATVDGSPESLEVLPVVEKLVEGREARVRLFMVAEREPSVTRGPSGLNTPMGPMGGVPAVPGGITFAAGGPRMQPQWNETDDQAIERVVREGNAQLESFATSLKEKGVAIETEVVVHNNAAAAIVSHARDNLVDFIAMATHGRSGFRELVQGSVASAVVKSGVAPVILVRPNRAS